MNSSEDPNVNSRIQRVFETLTKIAVATPKVANYRLAAAIAYKSRVISYGVASYKTSPFQKKYGTNEFRIYLHAEIAAIKNALYYLEIDDLKKTTLYVCRAKLSEYGPGWAWGMSKPCDGCQRAIAEFGIQNVLYTTEAGILVL